MFPLAELSGFGLNIEQEVKTRGTVNTVIKRILLLIDFLEGSLCIWLNLLHFKQTHLDFSYSFYPQPCWPGDRNVRFLRVLGDPEPISRKFYVFYLTVQVLSRCLYFLRAA